MKILILNQEEASKEISKGNWLSSMECGQGSKSYDFTINKVKKILDENKRNYQTYGDIVDICNEIERGTMSQEAVLIIVELDEYGFNFNYPILLNTIRKNKQGFHNSVGGLVVLGKSKLYTKSLGQELALALNMSGMYLVGKSLVEKTQNYFNFNTISKVMNIDNQEALGQSLSALVNRIINFEKKKNIDAKNSSRKYNILALHTSHFEKSNTMILWNMVKDRLDDKFISKEMNLDRGNIQDCKGCTHSTCLHFAKKSSCYYGGYMVEEVYPSVLESDALMLICPNYNDSTGANITAFINRLTALYKQHSFDEKMIFSIVVSGYSGGDIVARQLLGALNMNKGFIAPKNFSLMETANLSGEILSVNGIEERSLKFARNIGESLDFALKNS